MKVLHILVAVLMSAIILTGCAGGYSAPKIPLATQINAPEPINGNSGKIMSPYTSDGVIAQWVDKAINAKTGAAIGGAIGTYAGTKLAENVPFIGGWLGQKAGNAAGRSIAIKMAGGEEFIKRSSDLSFNSVQDLARWMYVNHSQHKHYQEALAATQEIYPELKTAYLPALISAPRKSPQYSQKQSHSSALSAK